MNFKTSQFSRFLLRSGNAILVKIWKSLKLLNSVKFIEKTRVNLVNNWIWSCWRTFTVLQWMKTNLKISQFSRFLLRSAYAILFKTWKWLKLLNFVPFIKKTRVNFQRGYMTNVMILISTLSIFHTFPATYHLALLMVCIFHSSLDMHDAAHTMMISDITPSAWLIDFCHKAI